MSAITGSSTETEVLHVGTRSSMVSEVGGSLFSSVTTSSVVGSSTVGVSTTTKTSSGLS